MRETVRLPARLSGSELFFRLKKLGMSGAVLHVAAHPDDEDIGLLTYVSFKLCGRAVYWSATRGESGQNSLNAYWGKALGIFRTWESITAQELAGGEGLFGPFVDFGYSKNAEEVFFKWGRKTMLRELVRAIRFVQPQIVVTRWTGTSQDLHGHHEAVGRVIREAFEAAGDPKSFPELQEEGLAPWRPLKLYCSINNDSSGGLGAAAGNIFGRLNPDLEHKDILRINTGEFNPAHGQSFQEQAWIGYNQHKSQGIGRLPVPGDFYYYFRLLKTNVAIPPDEPGIFSGLDPSLTGLAEGAGGLSTGMKETLEQVKESVSRAVKIFRIHDPLPSSSTLLEGLTKLRSLRNRLPEEELSPGQGQAVGLALDRKIREFEDVIAACMGLQLEAICTRRKVTPGESFWMSSRIWNHRNIRFTVKSFKVNRPKEWYVEAVEGVDIGNETSGNMASYEVFIGNDAELSCPYWLRKAGTRYLYMLPRGMNSMQALDPAPVQVECELIIRGHGLTLRAPALCRNSFPGGYKELPPAVVPPISLHPELDRKFFLTSDSEKSFQLNVTARCNDDERPAEGILALIAPEGWQVSPSHMHVHLLQGGGAHACTFSVITPFDLSEGVYTLHYKIHCRDRDYSHIMTPVRMGAPGLPDKNDADTCIREEYILEPAQLVGHVIDGRFIKERANAYVEGAKEELLTTLESLGVAFQRFSDHDIEHRNLGEFDVIVIGPNAYNLRGLLRENACRFLEYVRDGGTLIVQYQWYGYDRSGLTPYPFRFSQPPDRVTDENARITVLRPEDELFRFPNSIGPSDFKGWVHDRGLAFFNNWDQKYNTYLSCADPGESQQEGGLVGCRYGKGYYFYIGYSLFRQLPAGVPGAFRLFFNLLATGHGSDKC
jgi:LmbE family N-acetylglucosaminyl deacetylase